MIKYILKSIGITILVSCIVTLTCYYAFMIDPIRCFVSTTLIQFIFFYILNSYIEYKMRLNLEEQETERLKYYSSQGSTLQCASCKADNFVPVYLDRDNEFTCDNCETKNSIYVNITVAQKTKTVTKDNKLINVEDSTNE